MTAVKPKGIVLHSGGIDSTTTMAIAVELGYEPCAMSFRYGQRHEIELDRARKSAQAFGVKTRIEVPIDLRLFGGSALTDAIEVPKGRTMAEIQSGIPVTYVPARNTIFLAYALGWAEIIGANDIFIGVNALDYSGYPDCRPEFIEAFQALANLATRAGVETNGITIRAPLMHMKKSEIIRRGTALGVDYALTMSCYDPSPEGFACGACDSCIIRLQGFAEAGLSDPAPYRHPELHSAGETRNSGTARSGNG